MAKTVGKGKSSSLRGRTSAEPETDLVDSSSDEPREDEQDVAEDDELEDETGDGIEVGQRLLAPSDIPAELHRVEGRPRTVHIPEWIMGNVITRYAAESIVELCTNTTWPTWREAWNFTLIVLVMAAIVGVILGVADLGLTQVLTWFLGLGK